MFPLRLVCLVEMDDEPQSRARDQRPGCSGASVFYFSHFLCQNKDAEEDTGNTLSQIFTMKDAHLGMKSGGRVQVDW